ASNKYGLRLNVEVDDEVLGSLVGDGGIVKGVAGRVGEPGVLQLFGVGDEDVLAGGQPGEEREVNLAEVFKYVCRRRVVRVGSDGEGRKGDEVRGCNELRLVGVIERDVDERVIADVGGGGWIKRGKKHRGRGVEDRLGLVHRVDHIEGQG